ncbi:MAG: hypothetical protein M1820_008884 [Bogoriella megaspora]|nr:MAG: hypothetical protein M1820_008884 [Bogoriella megaspora]
MAPSTTSTPRRRQRTTTHCSPHFLSPSPSTPIPSTPIPSTPIPSTKHTPSLRRHPSLRTSTKSPHFPSPSPSRTPRPPKGTTTARFPPLSAPRFGLIQESLSTHPFHLLLAVILLNQTSGRAAIPVFHSIIRRFPEISDFVDMNDADGEELEGMVKPLGLGYRARTMRRLAECWVREPPRRGWRWSLRGRSGGMDYFGRGEGKEVGRGEVLGDEEGEVNVEVEGEDGVGRMEVKGRDERKAALEIGHLPGCGAYAWDSWRIFCRDGLRGREGRVWMLKEKDGEDEDGVARFPCEPLEFEEEWKRVLPKDKELRPFLGWMWLKEGWIWDPDTGYKERADANLVGRATNESLDWVAELEIWKEDLRRRGIVLGEAVRPVQGQGEGPKVSYLEGLSSSGSSDELSDVDLDEDMDLDVV